VEADAGAGAARGGVACGSRGRLSVTVVDHGAPDVLAEHLARAAAEQGDRRRRWQSQPGTKEGAAPVVQETEAAARIAGWGGAAHQRPE
jgi:hypothetical protein